MAKPTWQDIAKEAQDYRDASISRVKPAVPVVPEDLPLDRTDVPKYLLATEEVVITQTAPEDLVHSLAIGKLTSTAVTTAFLRRAGLAQALTNCITELLPERALARAKFLDEHYSKHGKPIGPLHGVPVSCKEHIGMKDLGLNAGFVSWWNRKGNDDARVLKILWNAGCVFYARTTEPQTLMHLETSNNLYGVTTNPFNSHLSPGGSSGGEGALIGMRGSCLGLGTDIAGSIRNPAANCGLYGLRPSSYRIPIEGLSATMAGSEQIVPVLGPLSTSLEGVTLFMKTVIGAKPWLESPSLVPIPWRDQASYLTNHSGKKVLKVGVMWHDEIVRPHPPITTALNRVVEKLKGVDGVQVVHWQPYKHDEAWGISSSLYFADGAQEEMAAIDASGEPLRPLSRFIIKENPNVKRLSVEEIWQWTCKREGYRSAYAKKWNDTATGINAIGELEGMVDVILCPVGPGAASPFNNAKYWAYTAQWNVLDYPALAFPVAKVDVPAESGVKRPEFLSQEDAENFELWSDGPEKYQGAPVSLQLVGRRYEDEKVIEALGFIKEKIGLPFAEFV